MAESGCHDGTDVDVSVIVAVRNGAGTLEKCLRSCISQRYESKEIIVVDGQSSDGTQDVIRQMSDSLAYWVSEPDTGIYSAWNKAVRASRGRWVCFLGCDDVWNDDDALGRLVMLATASNANFVSARVRMVDRQGSAGRMVGEPWSRLGMRRRMCVAHVGALHHRSLFDQFGLFDETYRIAGDYEFLLRADAAITSTFSDECVALMGDSGVSSRNLKTVQQEGFRVLRDSPNAGLVWALLFKLTWWASRARRALGL